MVWIPQKLFEKISSTIPVLTVDGIVFEKGKVLLIKRAKNPLKGHWALPGGLVDFGETVEKAVVREVKEETGLRTKIVKLVGVYSDPKRGPPGQHRVTIAYLLKSTGGRLQRDKNEIEDIRFFNKLPSRIGFDHKKIIADAKKIAKA